MVRPVIWTALMHLFLAPHGVQCLEPEDGASPLSAAYKLPWRDELCCDPLLFHLGEEGGATHAAETSSKSNLLHHPRCNFRNLTSESQLNKTSDGTCLDMQCRIDESWENLTCEVQRQNQSSGTLSACRMVVSLQQLFEKNKSEVSDPASINPVVYEGEESLVCSFSVYPASNFVTMVTFNISNAMGPPVLLRIPALPVRPSPPVNLSHFQTNKAELFVYWKDPPDFNSGPLRYELQYSFIITHPTRRVFKQVVSVSENPRVSLHLEPRKKYTIQIRCSSLEEPSLWSNWSEPYSIYLGEVSYIPEQVVARIGEKVSVYCVFNDRRMNASTAVWKLNEEELDRSLSHPVHEWVSQITFHASETGIYDILKCKKNFSIPFSQIYVQGGFIDISCTTSGDIDAMDCKWTNKEHHTLTLFFEWTSLSCDEMKEKESSGKEVVKSSSSCKAVKSSDKFCTISPLRGSCYKLWMGMCGKDRTSMECNVQSKPIYISPLDHVKPHQPTNVMAKSKSGGVLKVIWAPPKLPVQGLQFQYRFRSVDAENWEVMDALQSHWSEAVVPSMCNVYIVQVRCKLKSGKGYWSDWSDSVKSTPENSRMPERGPDFWRIRQDAPAGYHSNITVLFESSKSFPVSWKSYCVDGFIVQHQFADGSVKRERISQLFPYSFGWNQERHTVTVEAFNNLGSSITNTNMILEKQPKRHCVKSFHVLLINSTCVSLSWSLLDSSSVPQFMVVQWFPQRQHDFKDYDRSQDSWVRLPYTDTPVYIQRVFLFEEYNFHLYPVFSDGEGEAVITSVSKGEPTAYGILMSISFFCIFLLVTLFFSQKRMKRFVWTDVPNPNKCSWAKGLDFKKVDSSDKLFQSPECLQAFPLLLASEDISKVIIVDKTPDKAFIQEPFVSPTHDPPTASSTSLPVVLDHRINRLMESEATELPPVDPRCDPHSGSSDSTGQLAVTYAKVLSAAQQPLQHEHKDGSGSSSRDMGIFSAINSHMLASVTSELWELDSCHGAEINQLKHSSSPKIMEKLCKTSKPRDGGEDRQKVLYYLSVQHPAESEETEEEEEDEETKNDLLGNAVLPRQNCSLSSHPLLDQELKSVSNCGFPSLYMPQCRTAPCAGQLSA